MSISADIVIDHLGGTSAVAKLIEAPVSTVHSWRKIGIPQSRMAHLRLVARSIGNPLPDDAADHDGEVAPSPPAASTGHSAQTSGQSAGAA